MGLVHLVPLDRQNRRILESDKVCDAVGALGDSVALHQWATRFHLLGDPSRLALLVAIAQAGPISVTDLAVAADMNDTTVSQALRLLKAARVVRAHRDGRIVRYELTDASIARLLDNVSTSRPRHRHSASH